MGVLAAIGSAVRLEWVGRLAGPLFDKELRVSARRRRNYLLRFVYLLALTIYVAMVWSADVDVPLSAVRIQYSKPQPAQVGYLVTNASGGTTVVNAVSPSTSTAPAMTVEQSQIAARMADAGRAITRDIMWFELLVLPLLASIMLSAAVSEEIRLRTLDVLMSTPTSDRQIIVGKIASTMLQLVLLVAITLPLLLVVRVFGGVTWQYVAAGLGTVLLTCLFVSSITVYAAIRLTRSYEVVPVSVAAAVCLPLPLIMMIFADVHLMNPGASIRPWLVPAHITIVVSAAIIYLTERRLRAVGSRKPSDWVMEFLRRPEVKWSASQPGIVRSVGHRRPIGRWPVLWREIHSRMISNQPAGIAIGVLAAAIVFVADAAGGFAADAAGGYRNISAALMVMGIVGTAIVSSGGIAHEKEAGTLSALLATPLSRWEIVLGKAAGAARRAAPAWILMVCHLCLCVVWGAIGVGPAAVVLLDAAATAVFCIGLGLWISSHLTRATTAAAAAVSVAVILLVVLPILAPMAARALGSSTGLADLWPVLCPLSQVWQMSELSQSAPGLAQRLLFAVYNNPLAALSVVVPMLLYPGLGVGLIVLTVRRLNLMWPAGQSARRLRTASA